MKKAIDDARSKLYEALANVRVCCVRFGVTSPCCFMSLHGSSDSVMLFSLVCP
jgi:hypothetical protein